MTGNCKLTGVGLLSSLAIGIGIIHTGIIIYNGIKYSGTTPCGHPTYVTLYAGSSLVNLTNLSKLQYILP